MVKGWAANITPLYDRNIYKKYFEQLPDFRKEKAAAPGSGAETDTECSRMELVDKDQGNIWCFG